MLRDKQLENSETNDTTDYVMNRILLSCLVLNPEQIRESSANIV
jgi:hypothetical protein